MEQTILICGGTGLIGKALVRHFTRQGMRAIVLVRQPAQPQTAPGVREVQWFPEKSAPVADVAALEGCLGAIHLAGANIAGHRWTDAYRRQILESRVNTSHALGRIFQSLAVPPPVLVAASAVGYYGDRGSTVLTEDASAGQGFLPDVCRAWETATAGLAPRVAHMRFGIVLSARGGILPRMLPVFRFGLGSQLGDGHQWMSWVSLEDVVGAVDFAFSRSDLAGAFNVSAPYPVTNKDFTRSLGRVLHRPTLLRVPALALRARLGDMAQEMLLASTRAVPHRLQAAGFRFSHERLEQALGEMV